MWRGVTGSFERTMAVGFLASILAGLALFVSAILAVRAVTATSDVVAHDYTQDLMEAASLRHAVDREENGARGFLLSGEAAFLAKMRLAETDAAAIVARLRGDLAQEEIESFLRPIVDAQRRHDAVLARLIERRGDGTASHELTETFVREVMPLRQSVDAALSDFVRFKEADLKRAMHASNLAESRALVLIYAVGGLGLGIAAVLAFLIGRTLTRLHRQALDAVRARDDFISAAAHELKNPLNALQLTAQHLRKRRPGDGPPATSDDAALARIERQVRALASRIDALLDVTRLTSGTLRLEPDRVDLPELLREVALRATDELENAGCELHLRLEDGVVGTWDRLRLDQIVSNLLSNAVKYGRGAPIEIALTRQDDLARMEVTDHGIGIPANRQARIFERFQRVAPEGYAGLGLGLWIARHLVDAMGGRIAVTSEPAKGSTFTVDLPLGTVC